jgi:predicted O-methyltransferase YrrM
MALESRHFVPIKRVRNSGTVTTLLSAQNHQEGLRRFSEGQLEEALRLLGEALAEGETSELWNDWAAVQLAAHNVADAEKAFRRALKLEPGNSQAAANLGAVLASLGRDEEAIPLLERSRPGLSDKERANVAHLLLQCRDKLEGSLPAATCAPGETSSRIVKLLSLQTTALNSVALRLIAVEQGLERLIQLLAYAQSAEAQRREKEIVPKIRASEVLCDGIELNLLALDGNIENVSVAELKLILHLLLAGKGRAAFEFGTSDGRTTLNLAANLPQGARVYTLDLPRERLGERFRATTYEQKITQLIGETTKFDFSPYFNLMDFVFIDAGHDYKYVLNDSFTAMKLLRGGKGTIVWHDYSASWSGVVEAIHELFHTEPRLLGMRHIEGTALVFARVG